MAGQKKPKIVLNNYEYLMRKSEGGTTTWICNQYFHPKDERCKAKIVTSGKVAHLYGSHNHSTKQKRFENMLSQSVTVIKEGTKINKK